MTARTSATEKRKSQILAAALESFTTIGFAHATMGDVCTKAGVSTGSLYHHFGSKEQLGAALYVAGLRDFQAGFFTELEQHHKAERGIRGCVSYYFDWVVRNPTWARYLTNHQEARFLSHEKDAIDELSESFVADLAGWLLPFVERGEVQRMPRGMYPPILMGPCSDVVRRWLGNQDTKDPKAMEQALADAAWNSFRVHRPEARPTEASKQTAPPSKGLSSIEEAIEALAAGRIIIVVDAAEREDEGDFICAADKVTPEIVQFMTREGGGLFCMPILPEMAEARGFSLMVEKNTSPTETPFTYPVDHISCRTGISTAERARTVQAVLDPTSSADDFATPGHLFVLVAKEGGVLRRAGHTEATVDLARLAGLAPAGVLCEICSREGHGMAGSDELHRISEEFNMPMVSIEDVIRYRREREQLVHRVEGANAKLPTRHGIGYVVGYRVDHEDQEPVAFVLGDLEAADAPLVRMHSSCFTGDLLNSLRCDCGDQLQMSLEAIGEEGCGVIVYLPQEGRGIGLIEKLRAYQLQDQGMDTVEANEALGYRADTRDYMVGLQILKDLGLRRIRLLTNNPKKVDAFVYSGIGIEVVDQIPIIAPPEPYRETYLATKRDKLGHKLPEATAAADA